MAKIRWYSVHARSRYSQRIFACTVDHHLPLALVQLDVTYHFLKFGAVLTRSRRLFNFYDFQTFDR